MDTQNFIIESGSKENLTWQSHTVLNSNIDSLRSYYGDQCNIIMITQNQADDIQQAQLGDVAGMIEALLMVNVGVKIAA